MSNKPEALRLADELEALDKGMLTSMWAREGDKKVVAELRLQHSRIEADEARIAQLEERNRRQTVEVAEKRELRDQLFERLDAQTKRIGDLLVTCALALEALESCDLGDYSTGHVIHPSYDEASVEAAITALRARLAAAGQKETEG